MGTKGFWIAVGMFAVIGGGIMIGQFLHDKSSVFQLVLGVVLLLIGLRRLYLALTLKP